MPAIFVRFKRVVTYIYTYLDKEKLLRVNVPHLSLKVPLGVVGTLEGLALLGLSAAPDYHEGIAQVLGPGGAKVAGGLH